MGRRAHRPERRSAFVAAQVDHDVFHHHHRAFHHHAEIERAEREQVGGNVVQVEADRGEEQGKRDGERDDQSAAGVAQKQEQDQRHQHDAFGQVVQHGVGGEVHQAAAVEERNHLDAGRQNVMVQLIDLGVNRVENGVGVGALAQQNDALDHVAVVDHLAVGAMDRFADLAQADFRPLRNRAEILHPDGRAVHRLDHGIGDVVNTAYESDRAHVDLLQAGFDEAAARVDVVVRQLLLDLGDAQAIGHKLVRVERYLVFARSAAEADDIDHIGHRFELLFERPVFERFQLHQVVLRVGALERVPVDLADRAVVGTDLRLQAGRQAKLREALQHLLAIPVVGGFIVENEHQAGEAEQRCGAQVFQVRDAVHHDFDGDGNLLFHFFSGVARPLRDDLHIVVGYVGVGLDRQIVE